jgi:hypothetical protein
LDHRSHGTIKDQNSARQERFQLAQPGFSDASED